MEPTEVDRIPGEIDGTCWYRIKCSDKEYTERTSDLRWFMMRTNSRTGLVGRRKVGSCQGSYICSNKNCSEQNCYDCIVRTSLAKKEIILDRQKTTPVTEETQIPATLTSSQKLDDVEVIDLTQEINTTGNTTGESSF